VVVRHRFGFAVIACAPLIIGSCTSSLPVPRVGAGSPEEAAKIFFRALVRDDQEATRQVTCLSGWIGTSAPQFVYPAGAYELRAASRRIPGGWRVTVIAAQDGDTATTGPFKVVRKRGRYYVCGLFS
jgi:hypothetical protein